MGENLLLHGQNMTGSVFKRPCNKMSLLQEYKLKWRWEPEDSISDPLFYKGFFFSLSKNFWEILSDLCVHVCVPWLSGHSRNVEVRAPCRSWLSLHHVGSRN